MIITDLTVNKERAEAFYFSTPFMTAQFAILVKDPNAKSFESKDDDSEELAAEEEEEDLNDDKVGDLIWFRPFTVWLWLTFILTSIVLLFLIYFVEKFVSQKRRDARPSRQLEPEPKEKLFQKFSSRVFGTPRS
jgi:hypothetical protein